MNSSKVTLAEAIEHPLNDEQLCLLFGVWVYLAEDLPNAPPEEFGKYVVTTLKCDHQRSLQIPLADTYEEALSLAIVHLGLVARYSQDQVDAALLRQSDLQEGDLVWLTEEEGFLPGMYALNKLDDSGIHPGTESGASL